MFKVSAIRKRPAVRMLHKFVAWLTENHPTADRFLAHAAPFIIVSAFTNILGFHVFVPWMLIAVLGGVGLALLNLRAQIIRMSPNEERAERAGKALWYLIPASAAFSWIGFVTFFGQMSYSMAAPERDHKALISSAQHLQVDYDQMKADVLAKLENREQAAEQLMTRAEARLKSTGSDRYMNPESGTVALAEQKAVIDRAASEVEQVKAMQFVAGQAINARTVSDGYAYLQQKHGELGSMLGLLTKTEAEGLSLPGAPAPVMTEQDIDRNPISVFQQNMWGLASLVGLFLAILLELAPLKLAEADQHGCDGGEPPTYDGASVGGPLQPIGMGDEEACESINMAHAAWRLGAHAGTQNASDVERNIEAMKSESERHSKVVAEGYSLQIENHRIGLLLSETENTVARLLSLEDMSDGKVRLDKQVQTVLTNTAEDIVRAHNVRADAIERLASRTQSAN